MTRSIQRLDMWMAYLTPLKLNKLSHTIIWEEAIFDFKYVRLHNVDIPKEKWLNYLQTVENLIRRRVLRRLIWSGPFASYTFRGLQSSMG